MKKALLTVLLYQSITAIIGGIELIRTNGMGMPMKWLTNTPFDSFLIPGLILTAVIGGTSLLSLFLLIKNHKFQYESSAVAGFGIQIWIFTQIYMIQNASFLQIIYFASGIIILALTLHLLKIQKNNGAKHKTI